MGDGTAIIRIISKPAINNMYFFGFTPCKIRSYLMTVKSCECKHKFPRLCMYEPSACISYSLLQNMLIFNLCIS